MFRFAYKSVIVYRLVYIGNNSNKLFRPIGKGNGSAILFRSAYKSVILYKLVYKSSSYNMLAKSGCNRNNRELLLKHIYNKSSSCILYNFT